MNTAQSSALDSGVPAHTPTAVPTVNGLVGRVEHYGRSCAVDAYTSADERLTAVREYAEALANYAYAEGRKDESEDRDCKSCGGTGSGGIGSGCTDCLGTGIDPMSRPAPDVSSVVAAAAIARATARNPSDSNEME